MFKHIRKNKYFIIILIFSSIMLLISILFFSIYNNKVQKKDLILEEYSSKNESSINSPYLKEQNKENNWKILIPKINLSANIQEGTSQEIMKQSVGHFENTSMLNGNIGLAAHNRGYKCNFFQNIKNLKNGDRIIYIKDYKIKTYKVKTIQKIKQTDWSYLENTQDDRITLITCVENMPEYRLCVQAVYTLRKGRLNEKNKRYMHCNNYFSNNI